jgi:hypothetical protein
MPLPCVGTAMVKARCLLLIYEIPPSRRIGQTPSVCNRRYRIRIPHTRTFRLYFILFEEIESGFRVGSRRLGFCCCERGLLSVFTISIPIHPIFANQNCYLGCSLAQSRRCSAIPHMGPFLAQSHAPGRRRFFAGCGRVLGLRGGAHARARKKPGFRSFRGSGRRRLMATPA